MSYAAVLRTPHALRTFGAALLGRLSYGTVSLSLVLTVKDASGSFAVAGTVMALFGVTSVFLSPARAALIDRYGLRRALAPMAGLYAALLALLAVAGRQPACPDWLFVVLGAAAGVCTPPLGPVMRTLWGQLLPDRALLQRAFSLDGVAEELLYVCGPLIVGALVTRWDATVGIALSAVLVAVGTLALVTAPVPFPGGACGRRRAARGGVRGLGGLLPAAAGVGICLGALDLLVVARTEELGRPGTVAWVMAALSAGSAVGGLANGAVSWRGPATARLALLGGALGLAMVLTGFAANAYVLAGLTALAGLFVAPALTTAYLIADETARPEARTQAGAWVNTALNAGISGGTAAVGVLIGRLPLALCFAGAAVPVLCAAAVYGAARTARPGGAGRGAVGSG